jgi:hypothetical protein
MVERDESVGAPRTLPAQLQPLTVASKALLMRTT